MERGQQEGGCIPLDGRSVCGRVSVGVCLWGNVACVCVCFCGEVLVNSAWHREIFCESYCHFCLYLIKRVGKIVIKREGNDMLRAT